MAQLDPHGFVTVALTDRRIPEALPLIQAIWPEVDLATWRGYVKSFTAKRVVPPSGALALLDRSGGLCGILAYSLELDLQQGSTLGVRLFSAIDLHNAMAPARALLDAALAEARLHGCQGIDIRLAPEQAALARRMQSLGVSRAAGVYHVAVEPVAIAD